MSKNSDTMTSKKDGMFFFFQIGPDIQKVKEHENEFIAFHHDIKY